MRKTLLFVCFFVIYLFIIIIVIITTIIIFWCEAKDHETSMYACTLGWLGCQFII